MVGFLEARVWVVGAAVVQATVVQATVARASTEVKQRQSHQNLSLESDREELLPIRSAFSLARPAAGAGWTTDSLAPTLSPAQIHIIGMHKRV